MITLDPGRAFQDALTMLQRHSSEIIAVAGVFVLLPIMFTTYFAGEPVINENASLDVIRNAQIAWLAANWYFLVIAGICQMIGTISILEILLGKPGQTVGEVIGSALRHIIPYFLVGIFTAIAVFLGFLLLILPGIYLLVKFLLAGPIVVAENETNPVTAMQRSWAVTKGNSFRIAGMLIILIIVFLVIALVVGLVAGIFAIFGLSIVTNIIEAFFSTVGTVFFTALYSAVYLQLRPNASGGDAAISGE